jgi:hypothetical protein
MDTDSINKNYHSKVQVHPLRGGVLVLIFEWFWMYRKRTLICTVNVPFKIDWQEVRSFFFEEFKDDQVDTDVLNAVPGDTLNACPKDCGTEQAKPNKGSLEQCNLS